MGLVSSQFISKKYYVIVMMVVMILILGFFTIQAKGKRNQIQQVEQQNNQNVEALKNSNQTEKLTAWNIVKMCDWFLWPFLVITVAGIMLVVYRTLYEHREKARSQHIFHRRIKANDIRRLIHVLRGSHPSRVSRLMNQMISTYNKTNRAEPIGADVNQFLSIERESFETFNRLTGFISESAGALGLLGTVWGIFLTFHAGKLDGPTILQGMSVALVTTLVGLIISLFVNMGSTYVFTLFNEQLKLVSSKAEELRQALLYLEKNAITIIETAGDDGRNLRTIESPLNTRKQNQNRKPVDISLKSLG